jgi:NAD+ synthase
MTVTAAPPRNYLAIDAASVAADIEAAICQQVTGTLQRKGAVIGLSGGIDSSVVAALCAKALGSRRVLGIFMPERESSDDSLRLAQLLAEHLQIESVTEDITAILEAAGCYRRRDEAIRELVPEYGSHHKCKLVTADVTRGAQYALPSLIVESPQGEQRRLRLTARAYLKIVAASNFKQRVRKMIEYYHADRMQYAVAGTPNRVEYDQGFFVKNGDGAADIKPIAHLYKAQVYQLAEHYCLPDAIQRRPSTTDTFSLPQSQEEFYFSMSLHNFDLCLYGKNHGLPVQEVASTAEMTEEQVASAYHAIDAKRRATAYQHSRPLMVEDVGEVVGH